MAEKRSMIVPPVAAYKYKLKAMFVFSALGWNLLAMEARAGNIIYKR